MCGQIVVGMQSHRVKELMDLKSVSIPLEVVASQEPF